VLGLSWQKITLSSSSGFGNWEVMTKLVRQTSLRDNTDQSLSMRCPDSGKNSQCFGEVSALLLLVRITITLLFELAVNLKWVMVTR